MVVYGACAEMWDQSIGEGLHHHVVEVYDHCHEQIFIPRTIIHMPFLGTDLCLRYRQNQIEKWYWY